MPLYLANVSKLLVFCFVFVKSFSSGIYIKMLVKQQCLTFYINLSLSTSFLLFCLLFFQTVSIRFHLLIQTPRNSGQMAWPGLITKLVYIVNIFWLVIAILWPDLVPQLVTETKLQEALSCSPTPHHLQTPFGSFSPQIYLQVIYY